MRRFPLLVRIPLGVLGVLILLGGVLFLLYALLITRSNGHIVVNGERRSYILYVPRGLDPTKKVPLVISMHGLAGWPGNQVRVTQWNKLADEQGFIVVYPRGTGFPLRWRSGNAETSVNDVAFIYALIDKLETENNVDPKRIYANGFSNGGGMAFALSCTLSDRIAAIGTVSGAYLFPWSECQQQRAVPLIAFHGTADPVVPYLGGPSETLDLPFVVVPDWIAAYASHEGCAQTPEPLASQGKASAIRYSGCQNGAEVIFYTLQDGGHSWPGSTGTPRFVGGETNHDIDATRLIWNFFSAHPLP